MASTRLRFPSNSSFRTASEHTLKLGNKDFTNTYVYGQIDGKDAALLPSAMRTQTDLSANFLRDHDVLHFAQNDVNCVFP